MNLLPASPRARSLTALADGPLDLLVIGGGIVGAGIARDAAMRGMRTGLVDQHDFAFGTSSRSTRLLHGGLRYLAQGRVGLVREASLEKRVIHQIAPHLAQPLPFIFPTYRGSGWSLWQMRIGVKLYDLLCSGRNLGKSSGISKPQVLERLPKLEQKDLTGAVRYFDGLTNDARLVLDTLRSAVKSGARIANYVRFLDAQSGSGIWRCEVVDQLGGQPYHLEARAIVNATGPWADGLPHSRVKLRLSKGIHLVIPQQRLPVPEAVVITEGRRLLFAIPWGERVIVGTTDTDYRGSLDDVRAERADVQYVLRTVQEFFPGAGVGENDVIRAWAGLRPLIANPNGTPSDISRAHEIRTPEPGWWDVAGGKLTTYRLMAEQTVDQVAAWLREPRIVKGGEDPNDRNDANRAKGFCECRTAAERLLPEEETKGISGVLPPEFSRRVVEHFCANEWAIHLDDVMVRRTSWHYYYVDAEQKAERVANWMAELLAWSDRQRAAELERYRVKLNQGLRNDLNEAGPAQSQPQAAPAVR